MKKNILFLIVTIFFFANCSTTKKVVFTGGNGLSFETAVIINENTDKKGVDAEYAWIKEHHSNYKIEGQSLKTHSGTKFDVITIELSDGKELPLYFDISKFFGKGLF